MPLPDQQWRSPREVFPVKLTGMTDSSGTYLYSGTEQTIDPTSGALEDAEPALEFNATSCFLREANNNLVSVATTPIVWARFRGMKNGIPVFEFLAGGGVGGGIVRGKLDGALSAGGSATLSVWAWNGSAQADTGDNITVYDWLLVSPQTISSGVKVIAAQDARDGRYYVISAACETTT